MTRDPSGPDEPAAELLEAVARTPRVVRELAGRVPDPASPDAAGGWSVIGVVAHLAAVDAEIWGVRLGQLAAGGHPRWTWTEPDMTGRAAMSLDAALDAFEAGRATLVARARAMDADAWRRTGTHEVFGELDAAGLLRETHRHDLEHVEDLERRAAPPTEVPGA